MRKTNYVNLLRHNKENIVSFILLGLLAFFSW